MTAPVVLTRHRDEFGDIEYVTDDGYKVAGLSGSQNPWVVSGPDMFRAVEARNLDAARRVIVRARNGELSAAAVLGL